MGNPFEDLRQAVVVRPMNSPGPQGVAGPELKIQYSFDGSSWHDNPVETDRYLRFSTDNGVSWSDAIYFNNLVETLMWVDKARKWAEHPEDSEVEPGQYSALHHASKAALAASYAAAEASALIAPSIDKARKWAENPENVEVEPGKYSSLHWADKAEQWAENPEDVEVEPGKYSALHHATKAARSEASAEAAALDAARSAAEAFGAAAPAWNSLEIYNFPDVVAFTNGHTYRCIGTDVTTPPNIGGNDDETNWTRITVAVEEVFELDENGDLMPKITVWGNDTWELDENFDIMPREVA